jgi:dTDP-4-amino-4,6-dideoxygalactose transaminase
MISAIEEQQTIKQVPLLDVSRGNRLVQREIMQSLAEVIDSGKFINGPNCQELERSVAELSQTSFAIGCASGSDALLLALMAFEIGPGDEVICPSFTFFATASAITRLGACPRFVDIDPKSFNIDPALVEKSITSKTRAIIPVHLFGQCCDMQPILEVAKDRNLVVVEDAAQSIGASYRGRAAGSMGHIGCFSFYPTKNLGGFGDGGMLTTSDGELADRLRLLANHGMRPRYHHLVTGINSRLDTIQAAILQIKLKYLDRWASMRSKNASRYNRLISDAGLSSRIAMPSITDTDFIHVWNQYTIRIHNGQRDIVRKSLADANVGSEVYYPIPLHRQPCFSKVVEECFLPNTDSASSDVLSLPIFPELTETEQRYVVDCLARALRSA